MPDCLQRGSNIVYDLNNILPVSIRDLDRHPCEMATLTSLLERHVRAPRQLVTKLMTNRGACRTTAVLAKIIRDGAGLIATPARSPLSSFSKVSSGRAFLRNHCVFVVTIFSKRRM